MPHSSEPPPARPLTDAERTRVDLARQDLADARDADLAALSGASLILLVERLRGRLGDVLDIIDDPSRNHRSSDS